MEDRLPRKLAACYAQLGEDGEARDALAAFVGERRRELESQYASADSGALLRATAHSLSTNQS